MINEKVKNLFIIFVTHVKGDFPGIGYYTFMMG